MPAAEPGDAIVHFPGASDAYKCWPAESFAELIVALAADSPRQVVLSGTADWELDLAQRVVDLVGDRAPAGVLGPADAGRDPVNGMRRRRCTSGN